MVRKIIEINEEKCNGCGACASACHEGAIEMIDGKAKLTRDDYCDGFGDCLPNCPTGAITFVEREAAAYDETAVKENMKRKAQESKEKERKIRKNGIFRMPRTCPASIQQRRKYKKRRNCQRSSAVPAWSVAMPD